MLQEKYLSYFPGEGRINLVIATPSDGSNILTQEYMLKTMDLYSTFSNLTITYEVSMGCGARKTRAVCKRSPAGDVCGDFSSAC